MTAGAPAALGGRRSCAAPPRSASPHCAAPHCTSGGAVPPEQVHPQEVPWCRQALRQPCVVTSLVFGAVAAPPQPASFRLESCTQRYAAFLDVRKQGNAVFFQTCQGWPSWCTWLPTLEPAQQRTSSTPRLYTPGPRTSPCSSVFSSGLLKLLQAKTLQCSTVAIMRSSLALAFSQPQRVSSFLTAPGCSLAVYPWYYLPFGLLYGASPQDASAIPRPGGFQIHSEMLLRSVHVQSQEPLLRVLPWATLLHAHFCTGLLDRICQCVDCRLLT